MMEVSRNETDGKGRFVITENGRELAEMTYVHAGPGKFIIDHTEVFSGAEGRGLGKVLVSAAVDWARESGQKVVPLCPFAGKVMTGKPDYADVLA